VLFTTRHEFYFLVLTPPETKSPKGAENFPKDIFEVSSSSLRDSTSLRGPDFVGAQRLLNECSPDLKGTAEASIAKSMRSVHHVEMNIRKCKLTVGEVVVLKIPDGFTIGRHPVAAYFNVFAGGCRKPNFPEFLVFIGKVPVV
jgi:hypothetical protein